MVFYLNKFSKGKNNVCRLKCNRPRNIVFTVRLPDTYKYPQTSSLGGVKPKYSVERFDGAGSALALSKSRNFRRSGSQTQSSRPFGRLHFTVRSQLDRSLDRRNVKVLHAGKNILWIFRVFGKYRPHQDRRFSKSSWDRWSRANQQRGFQRSQKIWFYTGQPALSQTAKLLPKRSDAIFELGSSFTKADRVLASYRQSGPRKT